MAAGHKMAYGLDVVGARLVLVRAAGRGAPQVALAADANSEEARRALGAVAREVERGIAALAVAAPAAQTVVRRLRAPFASAKKAAKVWASLLDVELPFPVEGAACFYGVPRVGNGGTTTVAAAIRKDDLAAFDEARRAMGVDATHCDAEALALWDQLCAEAPPARAELPRALVWLGADHVGIARGRGPEFMAAHVLRAAPCADGTEARKSFETLWASRLGPILAAHLAETESGEMDLWWAGPGAEDEALAARLRRLIPAGVAIRHETVRQPASFLARALARRAAEGLGINFKTGEWAHPALARAESRRLRAVRFGVAAAAALVLALNAGDGALRRWRDAALQRELTELAESIAGGAVPRGQETLMAERALALRDEETQPFRNALDATGVEGRLVGAMEEAAALGVEISRLSASAMALSMEGSAVGIQAVEALADRLRIQGWDVQSENAGTTAEGRMRFVLKGTVRREG